MQLEDGSRLLGSEVRHRRFVWSKDDHTRGQYSRVIDIDSLLKILE